MCHDLDSRPPAPPRTGEVRERGVLTLTAADGTEFSAAFAAPAEAPPVGVAIDYFGRTAGLCAETGTRTEDFDFKAHIPQTTPEGIDADIAAAIEYLRGRTRADLPVVTVGFCFGGSNSWRQSGGDLDLAGCAGFYGKPSVVGDAAQRAHRPTVMIIAGADAATPAAEQLAMADTMRAGGADVDAV